MDKKSLVNLGSGKKPHGLKGEVEFWTASGNDTYLEKGSKVWLYPLGEGSTLPVEGKEYVVAGIRRGNQVLLKFEDVPDRTALEKLLPLEVYASRDEFPEPEEGSYYIVDMIGLMALNERGEVIGKIEDFFETPAQIIFTVALKNGERMDLPYVEQFFTDVDIESGTIRVHLPEIVE